MSTDFGPVKPVKGGCLKIIFIIVMIMAAIFVFIEPVRERLMEIITRGR